jgi:hypothetical protein
VPSASPDLEEGRRGGLTVYCRSSRPLRESGASVIAHSTAVTTRRTLDLMDVQFSIRREIHTLTESEATITAEELRRKATGQLGTEGVEGARALADAIETRLVGERDDPVVVDGDQAEALFYYLDLSVLDPSDPRDRATRALYIALRRIHQARLHHDAGPPSPA